MNEPDAFTEGYNAMGEIMTPENYCDVFPECPYEINSYIGDDFCCGAKSARKDYERNFY